LVRCARREGERDKRGKKKKCPWGCRGGGASRARLVTLFGMQGRRRGPKVCLASESSLEKDWWNAKRNKKGSNKAEAGGRTTFAKKRDAILSILGSGDYLVSTVKKE